MNKGSRKRIEVLVTNGCEIRRFLWIERTSNGIYYGFCSEGGEMYHMSYHEDGNLFHYFMGKTIPKGKGPKLSDFKGLRQLSSIACTDEIGKLPITCLLYTSPSPRD